MRRVYPFLGLSVTSRRGFRGRHLFFVLHCEKALRRRREGEERETQKEGNFLSRAWENFFLFAFARRVCACASPFRVLMVTRCGSLRLEVSDLYIDPFFLSLLILLFSQNSSHKISICSTHRRLSKLPSTNLNA